MADQEHAKHPTPRQYVQIAVMLAIITAVEVALFYIDESLDLQGWDAPLLVILSFLKFVIVIGWYMHLRFEKGMLSRFFSGGFILALSLYGIVLGSFGLAALFGQ
jgi:cytochrome c oxidase subunit 4